MNNDEKFIKAYEEYAMRETREIDAAIATLKRMKQEKKIKELIINEDNLANSEIDQRKDKVRGIIINDKSEVLLVKYGGIYMFPGGKTNCGESFQNGLHRELKEETGNDYPIDQYIDLVNIKLYNKNYPIRNSNTCTNIMINTNYYLIHSNKKVDIANLSLSSKEKKDNFTFEYVKIEELRQVILANKTTNPRNKYFVKEILTVIAAYEVYIQNNKVNSQKYKNTFIKKQEIPNFKNNSKLIDLHIHTCYSDGEFTPNQIINMSIERGIKTISFTDHDTISALRNIDYDVAKRNNIKIIPGIELKARTNIGQMHILGYGIDINNVELNKTLEELKINRIYRILALINQLRTDYNLTFSVKELEKLITAENTVGRQDLAKILINKGIVKNQREAFQKYLINSYNKIRNTIKILDSDECINLIKNANGIAILAHPNSLEKNDKELLQTIRELVKYGLMGVEVYNSSISKQETATYLKIVESENLLYSGGSDFHGPLLKPDVNLGTGKNNNLKIKELSVLNKL